MAPKADQEENKRAAMRASNRMEGYGVLFFYLSDTSYMILISVLALVTFLALLPGCESSCSFCSKVSDMGSEFRSMPDASASVAALARFLLYGLYCSDVDDLNLSRYLE